LFSSSLTNLSSEELHKHFLSPLEKLEQTPDTSLSPTALLGFYTSLLRNWAVTYATHPANPSLSTHLQSFLRHVGVRSLHHLQTSPTMGHSILTFYEASSSLPWENPLFRLVLPPRELVYHLSFVGNLAFFSRLCSVLVKYKSALELAMGGYPVEFVDHFNGYIMDLCNCLWRNRSFTPANNQDNKSAHACTLPLRVSEALQAVARDRGFDLRHVNSFSNSPIVAGFAADCFWQMEQGQRVKHLGPVTSRSLQKLAQDGGLQVSYAAYRVEVLKWLEKKGFGGVSVFMHATMQSLKNQGQHQHHHHHEKQQQQQKVKRRKGAAPATQTQTMMIQTPTQTQNHGVLGLLGTPAS
jgi:centromere protein I